MRRLLRFLLFIVLVVFFTSLAYLSGYGTSVVVHPAPHQPSTSERLEAEEEFRVFWEAWRVVQDNFYGAPAEPAVLTRGAIRGVIATLNDPFTWFADPVVAERIREDATGSYSGVGAVVNLDDVGRVIIVRPFAGGPADEAGLRPGDVILEIDGTDTLGLTLDQAVGMIRGPEGTPVRLTVQREGVEDSFEIEVVRAEIEIPSVEYRVLENEIAYLKVSDFGGHVPTQVHEALAELLAEQPRGLVLDLRDNPGGLLSSAIEIANEFIAEGVIALERGSEDPDEEHLAQSGGLATDIPLVVLVNKGTASASEIVAGAIRDHERGVLVGEHTFGKGSVQSPIDLSDGSHLRLTIAHWFTPDGQLITEGGLGPHIEVPLTEEDMAQGLDPQLDAAVDHLLGE